MRTLGSSYQARMPPANGLKHNPENRSDTNMASQISTRIVGVLFMLWLAIGAVAAGQRGYFGGTPHNCAGAATIGVTAVAGPLNYMGVNPKVSCELPQPSS